jgi:hypothetical protein
VTDKFDKFNSEDNSQENPAPFAEAIFDMLRMGVHKAMVTELVETLTGRAGREFGSMFGQAAIARLAAADPAMEDAYASYE